MGDSVRLHTYFDCNATTRTLESAALAAARTMTEFFGNPSSAHKYGHEARRLLEATRVKAAALVGAQPEEIIFTSGATEGIQEAVFSALVEESKRQRPKRAAGQGPVLALYGATEHKAVPNTLEHWKTVLGLDVEVRAIPVDSRGALDLAALKAMLPDACMVCTMAVNNETGVIHNLAAVRALLLEIDAAVRPRWLVDCVPAFGKLPLDLNELGCDYAVFSGHKINAPKGIGFFYARRGAPFSPIMAGGGQERGLRSGTENLPGVAGLGAVLDALLARSKGAASPFCSATQLVAYRDKILVALHSAFPELVLNTPLDAAIPTTLNFSIPPLSGGELVALFDAAGLELSGGSACNSASPKPSFVLDAMGVPVDIARSALRLSFGLTTTDAEVARAVAAIARVGASLRRTCPAINPEAADDAWQAGTEGVVCLSSDTHNTWVWACPAARTAVVIDPQPLLEPRIKRMAECLDLSQIVRVTSFDAAAASSTDLGRCSRGGLVKLVALDVPQLRGSRRLWALDIACTEKATDAKQHQLRFVFTGDDVSFASLISDPVACAFLDAHLAPETVICPADPEAMPLATYWRDARDGLSGHANALASPLPPEELSKVASQSSVLVVDVREPFEHRVSIAWNALGFKTTPRNMPLSRFANLLADLAATKARPTAVVFVCMSGGRSARAAASLAALGVAQALTLEGGLGLLDLGRNDRSDSVDVPPAAPVDSYSI